MAPMQNNLMLLLGSSSSSAASTSSLNLENFNSQNIFHGANKEDKMKAETRIQHHEANNISERGEKVTKGDKKVKRHRFAFQTRSHVDILDDGYRWRKYGQKAVKNSKFPRSYYRCTHKGCNVKKQIQRLSKDEEIVVTTYEGMHSHPLEKTTDSFEQILQQLQTPAPS
ncbi:probable WRKY transcription factor 43 [Quercus suber]|uniref:Wrky transcription factor 75 n=1 Tax=Quercus suber TaxID=58331 RepID=A0AAW0LUF2_QUESU|nr:probable WRKY transcription factor 43 [Quercus suber]